MLLAGVVGWASFFAGQDMVTAEDKAVPDSRRLSSFGAAPNRSVFIKGTWRLEGPEKIAFEKQVKQFVCHEREGTCQAATATVYKNTLGVDIETYDAKWSDRTIELTSYHSSEDCRRETITVDLITQEVVGITADVPNRPATCNEIALPISTPRRAILIDGFEKHFDDKFPNRKK